MLRKNGIYYKGKHAGNFSKVAAFSAHPLKNLNGIGDSGFITTNDKKIYEKIKLTELMVWLVVTW